MNEQSFAQIKKIVKKEGKVVIVDNDDAFVLLPLDEYEMLTDDLCGEECGEGCDCGEEYKDHDFDFGEEIFANNENEDKLEDDDKADQELIKRVNEDIAKWREEQANAENNKTPLRPSFAQGYAGQVKNQEIKEEKVMEQKKEDVLTEEERYYLEPLE